MVSLNCHYCDIAPKKYSAYHKTDGSFRKEKSLHADWAEQQWIFANGIDRVDNSKGYSDTNCVPCCSECNHAKGTKSYGEFIKYLERITSYRKKLCEK